MSLVSDVGWFVTLLLICIYAIYRIRTGRCVVLHSVGFYSMSKMSSWSGSLRAYVVDIVDF